MEKEVPSYQDFKKERRRNTKPTLAIPICRDFKAEGVEVFLDKNELPKGDTMEEAVSSYQVFINHRGPDTKRTLAALIRRDLKAEGVRVFLDENEIQTGNRNTVAIIGAITSSYVRIAIFSPKYAESSGCLDELCWMLDCPESKFIPIFHQVEPWELRHIEKGTYATAFRDHRENHGVEDQVLDKWKGALAKASGVKGEKFDPEGGARNIVEIADIVVNMVLEEVWSKESQEVAEQAFGVKQAAVEFQKEVAEQAVGLKQAAEEFQKEISNQYKGNGIITVGIVGAGGSGKSTLVKHLYKMKRMEFKRSYLLSVACEEESSSSQHKLLSCGSPSIEDPPSLLRRLQSRHHLRIEVPSNETSLLRRLGDHLQGFRQVLIILDEIYHSEQIKNLLLLKGKLGDGSMVVVTSRDRDLLRRSQVNMIYKIKLLDDANARYLFCQHAFGESKPFRGFEDSVLDVLRICEGLPSALEVLGRYFCGVMDQSSWDERRRSLDGQLHDDIKKILNPTYMSLDRAEKEVLLDVAHFLEGEDMDLVKRVLEGLDSSGIDCLYSLEQKGLVEFENVAVNFYDESKHGKCPQSEDFCTVQSRRPERRLKMKRLVRDFAREKAREEFKSQPQVKPLRLSWEDDREISLQPGHLSNVRGIRISKCFQQPVFKHISGLKLLVLEDSTLPFHATSGDLVWLRLHNHIRNQVLSIPSSLENLRVMELKGVLHLENLSIAPDDEPPLELRELTVDLQEISHQSASSSSSTRSIPPLSSRFDENPVSYLLLSCRLLSGELKSLVKLVWKNVKGLKLLPFKFEALRELRHLDLSGWTDLEELPDSFTSLSHLQYLALQDCRNLVTIKLGRISTFECLDFEGCVKLQRLPPGVTNQRSLRYLNLVRTTVQYLPADLGKLENLEQLFIGSPYLKTLRLQNLVHLTELTLTGCFGLRSISQYIEQLPDLEILRVLDSPVEILPKGIPWTKIRVLDVVNCPIKRLEIERQDQNVLSSLKRLSIRGTDIFKISIPDRLCPNIEIIDLSENAKLRVVEGVPGKLIRLNLMDCPMLNTLTCLSNMHLLEFLNISGCGELKFLNVQGLKSIEEIDAAGCWKLQSIQGFGQLQALSYFNISTVSKLNTILPFPSNVSTAILSVAASPSALDLVKDEMVNNFQHVTFYDISPTVEQTSPLSVQLRDTSSNIVIVVCFIGERRSDFQIRFECEDGDYRTFDAKGSQETLGSRLYTETHMMHIFMWTKDSKEFKDLKFRGKELISCTVRAVNPLRGPEKSSVEKGAIMMSTKKCDSVELLQLLCLNCNSRIKP